MNGGAEDDVAEIEKRLLIYLNTYAKKLKLSSVNYAASI